MKCRWLYGKSKSFNHDEPDDPGECDYEGALDEPQECGEDCPGYEEAPTREDYKLEEAGL